MGNFHGRKRWGVYIRQQNVKRPNLHPPVTKCHICLFFSVLSETGGDILSRSKEQHFPLQKKTLLTQPPADMRSYVLNFVSMACAAKMPVTMGDTAQKALIVQKKQLLRAMLQTVLSVMGYNFSESGVKRADLSALYEILNAYDVDCIFTMDESGFFFKLIPPQNYIV